MFAGKACRRFVRPVAIDRAFGIDADRALEGDRGFAGCVAGTIIGIAQALGETAPLLMIGMIAFIVDIPQGITDPATVLPVQIYLWADSPERAFVERTSAAIMVLLTFLILMNSVAILLRRRFERRW